MNIVNFSEARNNFKSVLDTVTNDKNCTVIVRRDAEDAVVMSKSYYDSLMETVGSNTEVVVARTIAM